MVLNSDPKPVLRLYPKYGEHPTNCNLSKAVKASPASKRSRIGAFREPIKAMFALKARNVFFLPLWHFPAYIMKDQKKSKGRAFTLIELLVVIAIIALFA